jgi:hypothetical protein
VSIDEERISELICRIVGGEQRMAAAVAARRRDPDYWTRWWETPEVVVGDPVMPPGLLSNGSGRPPWWWNPEDAARRIHQQYEQQLPDRTGDDRAWADDLADDVDVEDQRRSAVVPRPPRLSIGRSGRKSGPRDARTGDRVVVLCCPEHSHRMVIVKATTARAWRCPVRPGEGPECRRLGEILTTGALAEPGIARLDSDVDEAAVVTLLAAFPGSRQVDTFVLRAQLDNLCEPCVRITTLPGGRITTN